MCDPVFVCSAAAHSTQSKDLSCVRSTYLLILFMHLTALAASLCLTYFPVHELVQQLLLRCHRVLWCHARDVCTHTRSTRRTQQNVCQWRTAKCVSGIWLDQKQVLPDASSFRLQHAVRLTSFPTKAASPHHHHHHHYHHHQPHLIIIIMVLNHIPHIPHTPTPTPHPHSHPHTHTCTCQVQQVVRHGHTKG